MSVSVLNTDAGLSGKTLVTAEGAVTITAQHNYDRDPSSPFAVAGGSAKVDNLDADKWDGQDLPTDPNADRILFWDDSAGALAYLTAGNGLTITDTTITGAQGITNSGADVSQIKFAATQVPSSDVNTLDDYEEGTFTPTLLGTGGQSGQAYTTQAGHYVKVGKLVHFSVRLTMSTLGTVTTQAAIGNLPFTSDATSNYVSTANIGYWDNTTAAFVTITGLIQPNTTQVVLYGLTAGATASGAVTQGQLANTTTLMLSGSYKATA